MQPTLPFEEIPLILATMSTSVAIMYFFLIGIINSIGILVSDIIIDKKLNLPDGEYQWKEVGLLALSSAIITMWVVSAYQPSFWASLAGAWALGLVFRPLLPEIAKAISDKIRALLDALLKV